MYTLTADEKNELRRLTQKANRRIKTAYDELILEQKHKKGRKKTVIIPLAVAGRNKQIQKQWATESTPYSRSTKFETKEDFRRHMNELRSFDPGLAHSKPTLKEYAKTSANKILKAFDTAGVQLTAEQRKLLSSLSVEQQRQFWRKYDEIASKYFNNYSSDQVFADMASDPEVFNSFMNQINLLIDNMKKEKKALARKRKRANQNKKRKEKRE
ncbi:MAG: hypothetical protein ACRCWQ_04855 [Bacilli bacterium]